MAGERYKLIHGDCLQEMKNLADNSVDLIFADPPFNVKKRYGGKASNDSRFDYYEWCEKWVDAAFNLLTDDGTFYLMTIPKHLAQMFSFMNKRGVFINQIIWRNVSGAQHRRSFWNSYQPILVYGKTENYKFNQYAETRTIEKKNLRWGGYSTEPKGQLLDYWQDIPFVYAGSIKHPEAILVEGTNRKAHTCQMPERLAERAIVFSTDQGATVLDCFMGSGTTGISALRNNRKFIGIEKEQNYFEIAKSRIEAVETSQPLFATV